MAIAFSVLRTELASRARMNENDSAEKTLLNSFLNRAQEDVANFAQWWFLEHEFSLTPVASTRIYAFPTSDLEGTSVTLMSLDIKSMHTATGRLYHFDPTQQDRENPGWLNSSLAGSSGSPKYWTTLREQILFDVIPNSSWVSLNNPVYFRGYVAPTALSSNGDTSVIPANWHWVLVEGGLWRALAYQDPTGRAWQAQRDHFMARGRRFGSQSLLEQMVEQCKPVRKRLQRIPAPSIMRLSGRRSVNVRN